MVINGKKISINEMNDLSIDIKKNKWNITLAVVIVGDDYASEIYVKNKIKSCEKIGINSKLIRVDKNISQTELNNIITELNENKTINGILVQLPLPSQISVEETISIIDPKKDVDGLTTINLGKLVNNEDCLSACTPNGIMRLLKSQNINLEGKNICIINRSNLVGKPLIHMLLKKDATVTVCHSHTKNLKNHTKNADIIITAVGKSKFLTKNMIKKNAIVIDVAINRNEDNKLCGDADFEKIKNKCSYITPVPNGVGPMTISSLMKNTVKAYKLQQIEKK